MTSWINLQETTGENNMRISLIHGEDKEKAYSRFRELVDSSKKKGFEIIQITDIKNVVRKSLFEEKTVFVLDNSNKVKLADWKWLGKFASKYNSNLLIFYSSVFIASVLKTFPKETKVEKFDLPKIIFTFLDSFWPKNSKNSLKLLNDLVGNEPIELVFHLLARTLRDLYWAKVAPETMQIPDWRISKLKNQSNKFSVENLKNTINDLAEIDIKNKTTNSDLKSMLDILITKNLK